ncbi:MAG TPA: hypothetical protein VGO93_13635 [Candidatus Xenobia bacterium]|jgi:hypothetical protein
MKRVLAGLLVSVGMAHAKPMAAHVRYDLDGSGEMRDWEWISPRAGWLVYGTPSNGLRLLGSRTFWVFWNDGYDALSALDDNGDGQLTGHELDGLSIWQDLNGNGVCDPGELRSVRDWASSASRVGRNATPTGFPTVLRG